MKMVVCLGLLLLVLGVNLYLRQQRKRKSAASSTSSQEKNKESYLNEIRRCDKFDPEGYQGETKEKMVQLQEKADALVHDWLEHNISEEVNQTKTESFLEESRSFSVTLKERIHLFSKLQEEYEKKIDEAHRFFSENNFYPPDFTFLSNTLQEKHTEVKELKRTNPFSPTEPYQEFITVFSNQFQKFDDIHQKVVDIINRLEETLIHSTEAKQIEILECKQKIFFSLHQGDFSETQKLIEKARQKFK